MLRSLGLFALVAAAVAFVWHGLGRPIPMPPSPLDSGGKLTCISYAPFHGDQAPFTWNLVIPDRQIEGDLRRLIAVTPCVRTYSAKGPQGRVAEIAAGSGLEVLQGIWLGRNREDNRREIEAALEIARKHPDTVKALIVGSETLLRGELPPEQIRSYLEEVSRRSGLPVTYADVWEFWLKAPELAEATDFVTIHILPYWEDDPVSEEEAVAHVRQVRQRVAAAFPGKEILIGEVGWPSRGRMREGALPSPANQARFVSGVVQMAQAEGWKVNVVEAFDQPWKRLMEGTVGGYWGVYDGAAREQKFRFGEAVSNHPDWPLKAGLGIGAALLVFLAFWSASRGLRAESSWKREAGAAVIALTAGLLFGLAAVNLPLEGETSEDRLRAAGMLVLALVVPLAAVVRLGEGKPARWLRGRARSFSLAMVRMRRCGARRASRRDGGRRHSRGARACLRSALQGLSLCRTCPACRRPVRPRLCQSQAASLRAGDCRDGRGRSLGGLGAVRCCKRGPGQLAGIGFRWPSLAPCSHLLEGRGRARLSTSNATASAEMRVL